MKKNNLIFTILFFALLVLPLNLPAQVNPRPTTYDILSTPDASIFVDGLAVLNYKTNGTEIGFLKDMHGPITIEVYRKDDCGPYYGPPYYGPRELPENQKWQIEIAGSAPSPDGGLFYEDVDLPEHDFRYMPDLCSEKWLNIGMTFQSQAKLKDHLLGKLVLKDAVFYTELSTKNEVKWTNLTTRKPESLGRVGRVLGVNINFEPEKDGAIIIKKGIPDIPLLRKDGPFIILIRTKAIDDGDHIHLLYDHIIKLPSTQLGFDLQYANKEYPWHPCKQISERATEYACQVFGSCGGTLPDFP